MNIAEILVSAEEFSGYRTKSLRFEHSNKVYLLTDRSDLRRPSLYLKYHYPDYDGEERARTEIAAITLLQQKTNLPVPKSRLITISGKEQTITCLIQEELPGRPLSGLLERTHSEDIIPVVAQFAKVLTQIHGVDSDSYGEIVSQARRHPTWRECFTDDICSRLEYAVGKKILRQNHIEYFERKLEDSCLDETASPSLTHGDYKPKNILVDPTSLEITGLLDFESARFWRPIWDLTRIATIAFKQHPELLDLFLRVYTSITNSDLNEVVERIEFYRIFENLHFWVWGWGRSRELTDYIAKDVVRVTGIADR